MKSLRGSLKCSGGRFRSVSGAASLLTSDGRFVMDGAERIGRKVSEPMTSLVPSFPIQSAL